MDALSGLLEGPRARGAFVLRSVLEPPWSLRIRDEAPLTVVVMVRGDAWVLPDTADPAPLHPGDVAILRGPDHYTVADDPATAPHIVIDPGQRCTTLEGDDLTQAMDLGVRTWGNDLNGSTVLFTGTYQTQSAIGRRLLDALPTVLVLSADAWECPLTPLLGAEIVKDEPGQEVVLDRLLDLLLIAALRTWFSRPDADVSFYRALGDPSLVVH